MAGERDSVTPHRIWCAKGRRSSLRPSLVAPCLLPQLQHRPQRSPHFLLTRLGISAHVKVFLSRVFAWREGFRGQAPHPPQAPARLCAGPRDPLPAPRMSSVTSVPILGGQPFSVGHPSPLGVNLPCPQNREAEAFAYKHRHLASLGWQSRRAPHVPVPVHWAGRPCPAMSRPTCD